MQKTPIKHLLIVILLMTLTGLVVYLIVTPTATAPTNPATDAEPLPVTPGEEISDTDISTTPTPEPTVENSSAITLTTGRWNWQGTNGPGRSILSTVPNRNPFILTFTPDGSASSATDCNSMSGSYTTNGEEALSFGDFAMTMMYCEDSKEYEYSQQLGQVTRFSFPDDNTLHLYLADDAGIMVFALIE